jgi:hypothetical protein
MRLITSIRKPANFGQWRRRRVSASIAANRFSLASFAAMMIEFTVSAKTASTNFVESAIVNGRQPSFAQIRAPRSPRCTLEALHTYVATLLPAPGPDPR